MKPIWYLLSPAAFPTAVDRLVEQEDDDDDDEHGRGPKRADIGAVFQEMSGVLVPRVINKNAKGDQFRCAFPSQDSK